MENSEELNKYVILNNGNKMPIFGLGTYAMDNWETIKKAVTEEGYRMYDCASFYKNEEIVGKALNEILV
jgi:diketogulonate reductase-like aldo/keto reductase